MRLIAHNPSIGHSRPDLDTYPILFWPVGTYLVVYRQRPEAIEIVAVTQGSRDIPALLIERVHD